MDKRANGRKTAMNVQKKKTLVLLHYISAQHVLIVVHIILAHRKDFLCSINSTARFTRIVLVDIAFTRNLVMCIVILRRIFWEEKRQDFCQLYGIFKKSFQWMHQFMIFLEDAKKVLYFLYEIFSLSKFSLKLDSLFGRPDFGSGKHRDTFAQRPNMLITW